MTQQSSALAKNILHLPLQQKKPLKEKHRTHNHPPVEKQKAFVSELVTRNPSSATKEKNPVSTTPTPSVPRKVVTLEAATLQPIERKQKRTEICSRKLLTKSFLFFALDTHKETRERRLVTSNQ